MIKDMVPNPTSQRSMNVRSAISSADQAVEVLRSLKNQKRPVRVDFAVLGVSFSLEGLVIDAEQHFFAVEATTEPPSTLHSEFIWADTFSGICDDDWCFLVVERFAGEDFAECRCVLESGWELMGSPPTINLIDVTMSFDILPNSAATATLAKPVPPTDGGNQGRCNQQQQQVALAITVTDYSITSSFSKLPRLPRDLH